ncbi:MAG: sigma 54-interacting transcriptional regulator [Desulfobacteraceae bacterium]|nr:sigma 54-interacting transcriptional regulator [Desulfobacteraceae bacterium]MBC2750960.1 sigma 54-interacting transcriptional regulator [Desulfobacteraceae bacterium]
MEFERLLAEISTLFINLPADRIDSEIKDAQRRVCKRLDFDRSTLFQLFSGKPGTLLLTHLHQPPESVTPPEKMDIQDFWPWSLRKVLQGEPLVIARMNDLPAEAERDRQSFIRYGTQSMVGVPLSVGGGDVFGLLTFAVVGRERDWPAAVVQQIALVAQIFANALVRKLTEQALGEQLAEIRRLKQQLEQENIYLREEIMLQYGHNEIVGRSNAMKRVLAQVEQVADTDATVLLSGETGTGKELLARTIHNLSNRKERPLITINCAVLPPTLIESELFGREKGAYTGAMTRMAGRFEVADRSTLFLDEIGELPLDLQAKLLRVLEEGRFERLGSTKSLQADVRIIAATNRDLAQEVATGKFRSDLFYRLNVFPISIPPLRERAEDIDPMVWMFVKQSEKKLNKRIDRIPRRSMEALKRYPWLGNARELRNIIEHAMILCNGTTLHAHPPKQKPEDMAPNITLADVERRHILSVLEKTGWRVTGAQGAAQMLGLKRTTLQSKMKRLGIQRPSG